MVLIGTNAYSSSSVYVYLLLGEGQAPFSSKKRHSDVAELIGGNLGAKFQGRRHMAPRSAERSREGRSMSLQQDDSLRMVSATCRTHHTSANYMLP